jgi:hypothetical protein
VTPQDGAPSQAWADDINGVDANPANIVSLNLPTGQPYVPVQPSEPAAWFEPG